MSNPTDPAVPALPADTVNAIEREVRRYRIMERLECGWSYERIARTEDLTPRRIRQIVAEALALREVDPAGEHIRVQTARLEAALRLAAERVEEGQLAAIDRLLRVLVQLDRYHSRATAAQPLDEQAEAAAAFDAKLDALVLRAAEDKAQAAARRAAETSAPPASTDFGFTATL
jgi:hypothetical protein